MSDYYQILGVNKTASPDEIKAAFRRLAHEHHPDKSGGEAAKFKEINEAYQVLSDEGKRKQYDQFGPQFEQMRAQGGAQGFEGFRDWAAFMEAMGRQNGGGQSFSFDMGDMGDLFGGLGEMFGFGGGGRGRQRGGQDLETVMNISFEEAVFGTEKTLDMQRDDACGECKGSGAAQGARLVNCKTCGGQGRVRQVRSSLFGRFETVGTCETCEGMGKIPEKPCSACRGEGIVRTRKNLRVKIPAGIDNGETLRITGEGGKVKAGKSGDLYVHIRVQKDARFVREGYDIHTKLNLTISEATLGATKEVQSVYGVVSLKIPPGTTHGMVFRIRGKGVPHVRGGGTGDHLVEVKVDIPQKLSRRQKELLEELKQEGL